MNSVELIRDAWKEVRALFVVEEARKASLAECFELTRRLILRRCAPVFGVIGIAIVLHAHFSNTYTSPLALAITTSGAVLLLVAPFLPRLRISYGVTGFILTIVVGTGLFVDGWMSGGINAPVVPILCVVPLLATFFSGPRSSLAAGFFISMLLVGLMYAPSEISFARPDGNPAIENAVALSESRALAFSLIAVWAALVLVLSFYYLVAKISEGAILERDRAGREFGTISNFLSTLSHDLRTPLNAIIGLSGIMVEDAQDREPDVLENASLINESGIQMLNMLNDLLLFAKMESKQTTLDIRSSDLAELLDIQIKILQIKASERGQTISFGDDRAAVGCECDPHKISRLAANLIGNALKYSPDGARVEVSVARIGDQAVLSVKDEGIGMAPEDIEVALSPFGQVNKSSHESAYNRGVGLGLNICKEIVDLHGGALAIESEKGMGTRVTVALPLKQPSVAAA